MPDLESLSRGELVVLAREQAVRISEQDAVIERQNAQIASMARQIADLMDRLEQTAEKLARLEHLLSRNSANSNFPSSKDGTPGGTTPSAKPRRTPSSGRKKGKQKGAPGSRLRWTEDPDDVKDLFPQGGCDCGTGLVGAVDLGVVDRFQQHEVPLAAVTVTQFDQHAVSCTGCGQVHTAPRPEGAGAGRVEYGPQLKALAIYLMVMHHLPIERCCDVLESFAGARPSTEFVHGLLTSTAAVLEQVDQLIRTLITLAYAVCCDETPIKSGPATPPEGKKKAEQYLHVACTELYTHYLLGDRSMDTFTAFVYRDLHAGAVIVHDRYINYDSAQLGTLTHQLDTAHLLRDLTSAAETHPDAAWPGQITDALRELIHRTNQARREHHTHLRQDVLGRLTAGFRHGVRIGLSETL
ncbi:transposase, partial [Streptomyces sp. NPDC005065]|uniref:IS66 family transposase n=1 Tax=Streptomyces sp. NPDC005065 TaxID=3154461 RepID=UPI0033A056C0